MELLSNINPPLMTVGQNGTNYGGGGAGGSGEPTATPMVETGG